MRFLFPREKLTFLEVLCTLALLFCEGDENSSQVFLTSVIWSSFIFCHPWELIVHERFPKKMEEAEEELGPSSVTPLGAWQGNLETSFKEPPHPWVSTRHDNMPSFFMSVIPEQPWEWKNHPRSRQVISSLRERRSWHTFAGEGSCCPPGILLTIWESSMMSQGLWFGQHSVASRAADLFIQFERISPPPALSPSPSPCQSEW